MIKQAKMWVTAQLCCFFAEADMTQQLEVFLQGLSHVFVVTRTVVQSPQWLSAALGLIMKRFFVLTALPEQDLCSSHI